MIEKSYILTVKNIDNWTLVITRLYYLSFTITTDTSHAQMGCSRNRKMNFAVNDNS